MRVDLNGTIHRYAPVRLRRPIAGAAVVVYALAIISCLAFIFFLIPLAWVLLTLTTTDVALDVAGNSSASQSIVEGCPDLSCTICCRDDVLEQLEACPHVWIPAEFRLGNILDPFNWLAAPFTLMNYFISAEQVTHVDEASLLAQQTYDLPIPGDLKRVIRSSEQVVSLEDDSWKIPWEPEEQYYNTYELDPKTGVIRKTIHRFGTTVKFILIPFNDTDRQSFDCYKRSLGVGTVADSLIDVHRMLVSPLSSLKWPSVRADNTTTSAALATTEISTSTTKMGTTSQAPSPTVAAFTPTSIASLIASPTTNAATTSDGDSTATKEFTPMLT